jgi:hypothetical protein
MSEGLQVALFAFVFLVIVVTPFILWYRKPKNRRDRGVPPHVP